MITAWCLLAGEFIAIALEPIPKRVSQSYHCGIRSSGCTRRDNDLANYEDCPYVQIVCVCVPPSAEFRAWITNVLITERNNMSKGSVANLHAINIICQSFHDSFQLPNCRLWDPSKSP